MRPQATTTIPGGMPLPTRSFVYDQRMVFGMTFLSCVTVHVVRKSFTASKMELHAESDWLFPSKYLGTLDMLFLLCYAVGLLFSGNVIGYFNPKKSLLMSMVLTFVCYLCMGTVHFLGVRELRFFALLMSLNGFAQSPMWPACLTLLSHWYSKETRGAVFGWWSISVSLGNILGNLVISSLTSAGFSAGMMLAAPSVFALASALTLVFITNHPRERSDYASLDIFASQQESRVIPSGGQPNSVGINDAAQGEDASETKSLSLFQTFLLPGVAVYSVSLMFIKSTAFACVFWLPFYLSESPLGLSFSYADEIGSLGDVGTMMGAVMIGMMSDRFGGRLDGVLSSVYLAAAAIMIHMLYAATSAVMVPFSLLMVGMMTGGPNMLIGAAVATKLGKLSLYTC